jgi:hypothetical protein
LQQAHTTLSLRALTSKKLVTHSSARAKQAGSCRHCGGRELLLSELLPAAIDMPTQANLQLLLPKTAVSSHNEQKSQQQQQQQQQQQHATA